jgi:anti-sigma factor RsiW
MCTAFEKLIPRFVNGELPIREARRVELHLALCERCRRAVPPTRSELADGSRSAASSMAGDENSLGRLRSRMAAQQSGETGHTEFPKGLGKQWWLLAAGCVLLLIISVFITH